MVPVTLPKSTAPASAWALRVPPVPWSMVTPVRLYPVMAAGAFTSTASPPAYDRGVLAGAPFTVPPVAESRYTKDTVYPFRFNTAFRPLPRISVPALTYTPEFPASWSALKLSAKGQEPAAPG